MKKLLFALLTTALSVFGQGGFGSISGRVADASKSAVPGAKVTVSNEAKGIKRELSTNEAGLFNAPALPPAAGYAVTVNATGFADFEQKDILVQVGQNVDLTVNIQVAGTATQVDVSGTAELVENTKTEFSNVIDTTQIQELPINGRRFDQFVLLTPGVVQDGTFGLISFRGMAGGNSFLTDGNDTTNQYYNEAPGRTRIRSQISQDAVQEFQVISAAYLPEYGRASGGVINTVTRSGSNDFHGTGFWFFRNRTLNARDRFAAFNPPEYQHQTGGSIGGPIKKDKLFFFLNSEILRRHNPIASTYLRANVIDSNAHFLGCGAPATPAQCQAIDTILPRQYGLIDRGSNSEIFFAKLDWHPNDRHTVSASMNYLKFISPNGVQTSASYNNGGPVGNNGNDSVRDRYGRLSVTSIISNNMLNEARFGFFKDRQADDVNPALIPSFGALTLTVNGATNLGISAAYPRVVPSELRFNFADNLSWTKGRHTAKFGFDMNNTHDFTNQLDNVNGTYTYGSVTSFALDFSGNTTGAKNWQTYSQSFGNSIQNYTVREWAFYAQDQFRVKPHLTINYGLRYDYAQLPTPEIVNPDYPQTGRIPNFTGGFGPRVGLAYTLTDKTVIRAGWGLFQSRYGLGIIRTFLGSGNGIFSKSASYTGTTPADNAAGPVWPNKLAATTKTAGTVSLTFPGPDFRPPYSQNGDVSIERQIGRRSALTVSYLYNRGFQITSVRDLNIGPLGAPVTYTILDANKSITGTYTTPTYRFGNRVDPRYAKVNQVENGIKSWYDGLAVNYRGEVVKGAYFTVAYTWSHAIDLGQGLGDSNNSLLFGSASLNSLFNGDVRQDKGNGQLDQRHRFIYTFVLQHDFTKRHDALSRHLMNGWQLSGVTTLASGRATYATINIISKISDLTNFTLNGFGGDTRVPFWQVNPILYDAVYRLDARLTKAFSFKERYKLTLAFEAFNVSNSQTNNGINHNAYDLGATPVPAGLTATTTLTPRPDYGLGSFTGGFPDGTTARRAQVSARFVF